MEGDYLKRLKEFEKLSVVLEEGLEQVSCDVKDKEKKEQETELKKVFTNFNQGFKKLLDEQGVKKEVNTILDEMTDGYITQYIKDPPLGGLSPRYAVLNFLGHLIEYINLKTKSVMLTVKPGTIENEININFEKHGVIREEAMKKLFRPADGAPAESAESAEPEEPVEHKKERMLQLVNKTEEDWKEMQRELEDGDIVKGILDILNELNVQMKNNEGSSSVVDEVIYEDNTFKINKITIKPIEMCKFIIRKIRKETETETENINMENYIYYGYDEKGNVVAINLF